MTCCPCTNGIQAQLVRWLLALLGLLQPGSYHLVVSKIRALKTAPPTMPTNRKGEQKQGSVVPTATPGPARTRTRGSRTDHILSKQIRQASLSPLPDSSQHSDRQRASFGWPLGEVLEKATAPATAYNAAAS